MRAMSTPMFEYPWVILVLLSNVPGFVKGTAGAKVTIFYRAVTA